MVLKKISIKDFLSIRGTITVDTDPQVTILLGANDHGKSNILTAIEHSNAEMEIEEDETNWDAAEDGEEARLEYDFQLRGSERGELEALLSSWIFDNTPAEPGNDGEQQADDVDIDAPPAPAIPPPTAASPARPPVASPSAPSPPVQAKAVLRTIPKVDEKVSPSVDEVDQATSDEELVAVRELQAAIQPELPLLRFVRAGVGVPLSLGGISLESLPSEIVDWLNEHRPRVELFKAASGELQDSVIASDIADDKYEFLQGVFFYAGLDPLNCADLFKQTDVTERALDRASTQLDGQLRRLWGQGTDLGLTFHLRHRHDAIEFMANDSSVKTRKTRMSKRSLGVTQFFRISMVLHARRCKHPANSYIFLFDEPGVFLHPQGQKDLIQVFEQLSTQEQVIYTTHSLFLLNQNFPERHRLIVRDKNGTKVDQKPYRANWRLATDALGVYLTSNIIFSSKVLLVEGDSDPIYIYEMFRYLNQSRDLDADANTLGIFSFSDLPNLRFLLQIFKKDSDAAKVLVLVDGDSQGKATLAHIRRLCERLEVPTSDLLDRHSIEDYAISPDEFIESAVSTIRQAMDTETKTMSPEVQASIRGSWKEHIATPKINTGKWFKEISKKYVGSEASKVALARSYAFACRDKLDLKPDDERRLKALKLCRQIAEKLVVPRLRAQQVVESSAADTA